MSGWPRADNWPGSVMAPACLAAWCSISAPACAASAWCVTRFIFWATTLWPSSRCGLFIGFVLGLQGFNILQRYGSSEALGQLVTLSLVRELGPVVTALLFAGRAGTSLTAEIGLMKAGEQLSAMEMMAVDPVRRILAPRFWAGVITLPLL